MLFASFWQAGFESASHRNSRGIRVDMIAATQHVEQAEEDYARLREMDIRVADGRPHDLAARLQEAHLGLVLPPRRLRVLS